MARPVVYLSIPALRAKDVALMPRLGSLADSGEQAPLVSTFPCLTCPVQAAVTTGADASQHGVIANGFYWRDRREVEMWTAWNEVIQRPQVWDVLHERMPGTTSAAWFPMNVKGAGADYICTPAPIHNPDGSESLWCYTKPEGLYGALRDRLGHFPLQHFWGPIANRTSSQWIADSAVAAAGQYRPDFLFVYLPHLDYAPQKHGPDSAEARQALRDLDEILGSLIEGISAQAREEPLWLIGSEYAITSVSEASFPNRVLREAGYLTVTKQDGAELLDLERSRAWALVDHQLAHVYVADAADVGPVAQLLRDQKGVAEALTGPRRQTLHLDHPRSGEIVLASEPDRWFAYYWWLDDRKAPPFARTVDIHRKPGYDPVELFFDPATKGIPLDASLVKGSHGLPADRVGAVGNEGGVLISSRPEVLGTHAPVTDTEVMAIILNAMGCAAG